MAKKIQKKEINLYSVLNEALVQKKKAESKGHGKAIAIALGVIIVLAIGAVYAYLFMNRLALQNQLDEADRKLMNPDILSQAEEAEQASLKYDYLINVEAELDKQLAPLASADKQFESYTKDLFGSIIKLCPRGVTLKNYDVQNNSLVLAFTSENAQDVSAFVKKLRDASILHNFDYTGFSGAAGNYEFTLQCEISEKNPVLPAGTAVVTGPSENENGGEDVE